jgi:hypothetical protein
MSEEETHQSNWRSALALPAKRCKPPPRSYSVPARMKTRNKKRARVLVPARARATALKLSHIQKERLVMFSLTLRRRIVHACVNTESYRVTNAYRNRLARRLHSKQLRPFLCFGCGKLSLDPIGRHKKGQWLGACCADPESPPTSKGGAR